MTLVVFNDMRDFTKSYFPNSTKDAIEAGVWIE